MKKILSLFILTISTHAAADVINCPTPKEYTLHQIPWKLLVSKNTSGMISPSSYDQDFYNYDPKQNILEGNSEEIYGAGFEYNIFSSRSTKDEKGITLQCTGIFLANECPTSIWSNCISQKRYLRASLFLGHEYKSCMPMTNTSFDCETTRDLIYG